MADQRQDYAKVVARAWSDETFKAQLLNEPATDQGRPDLKRSAASPGP